MQTTSTARRATWPGLIVAYTILVGVVPAVWLWGMRSEFPAQLATHWTTTKPDGFSSFGPHMLFNALLITAFGVGGAISAWYARHIESRVVGITVWLITFMSGICYGTTWVQRGLQDASDVRLPAGFLAVFLAVATALGLIVWWVARRGDTPREAVESERPTFHLPTGAAVAMIATTGFPRGVLVLLGAVFFIDAVVLALSVASGAPVGMLALTLLPIALIFVIAGPATVTAGPGGVTVRSMRFIRWFHAALDDIDHAEVRNIDPLTDFGGWGLRLAADGSRGYVTRSGPGLVIHRKSKKPFAITVKDAESFAATVNASLASSSDRTR